MTEALFLADLTHPRVGEEFTLDGDEGRHAAAVRRIRPGETILVADGAGHGIRGEAVRVDKNTVTIRVDELLDEPEHGVRFTVVQALAKGDRAELAVEMLTEVGVDRIIPWQASRSVVKWAPERRDRQVGRWRTAARKATKQSRRLSVPVIPMPMTTSEVAQVVADAPAALILHESAERMLRADDLAVAGDILVVVGPEGGLSDDEVATFAEAGGRVVLVSDGVLRTSTAGVVAVAAAQALLADADGRA